MYIIGPRVIRSYAYDFIENLSCYIRKSIFSHGKTFRIYLDNWLHSNNFKQIIVSLLQTTYFPQIYLVYLINSNLINGHTL